MGIDACIEVRGVQISQEDLRREAGNLAECIGYESLWIDVGKNQHCLEINEEGNIQVNTLWRYYGDGYERGPWMNIRYTLLWLMRRFPEGSVYYFRDSGGCDEHEPVTQDFLDQMDSHFLAMGHTPYHSYFGKYEEATVPECGFCLRPKINHGGGGGKTFWQCHGCGQKWIDGELLPEGEDFFKGADRIRKAEAPQ